MPPKVDIATRRALEAAAAVRQAEKKAGQYQLKRIRRGPAAPAPRSSPARGPVISEAIPLPEIAVAEAVRPEPAGGQQPETPRERIRPALLLGEAKRFEIMTLQELGGWAYCFASSVSPSLSFA